MKAVPYILGINQGVVKEMASYSHTPACYLSKLRSSIEAGKKQLRVWLQYVCGVTEMLLYSSFGVGFNPTFLTLGRAKAFVLHSLNRKVPLVFLWSPYGDSEMARNGFLDEPSGKAEREDGSKWCATGNVCSSAIETGFVTIRTFVQELLNLNIEINSLTGKTIN